MKIADCHVHIENGFSDYDLSVDFKNVIFNSVESYKENRSKVSPSDSISLIFDFKNNLDFVLNESVNIQAFKIHSRFQQISSLEYEMLIEKLKLADKSKPIIIDAFYYGKELAFQPDLVGIIKLISQYPERNFIIAHCGGYEVLKYFFHLRQFENVYYDLSLSLQYFSDASILKDFVKLIKFTPKEKIMFGSDYHYASPKIQFDLLCAMCDELKLSKNEKSMIFYDNAVKLFSKHK